MLFRLHDPKKLEVEPNIISCISTAAIVDYATEQLGRPIDEVCFEPNKDADAGTFQFVVLDTRDNTVIGHSSQNPTDTPATT